jgi:hypothetical protein
MASPVQCTRALEDVMLKMLGVIVVLVAAVCVLAFASGTVERAYASRAAPTETVDAVTLPTNEPAVQKLGEAIADDGTDALPGQVEPVLVGSPQRAKQNARQAHPKKVIATQ